MGRLEDALWADRRGAGGVFAGVGLLAGAGTGRLASELLGDPSATALSATVAIAGRQLWREARGLQDTLQRGDLDGAREGLAALCGRDASALGVEEISRAVCESVAENTVDAVVAPLLWAAAGGAPGALAYRAVNTLDAMVGHRNLRYERFGWAAARLDDLAGWVPARLTAVAVGCCRPGRWRLVRRAVALDAPAHPSPNAGVAEAAFAAALGVRLGGPVSYGGRWDPRPWLHPAGRACGVETIGEAVALSRSVCGLLGALVGGIGLLGGRGT
jgi:adenosylcobinamide-phosphate synthase